MSASAAESKSTSSEEKRVEEIDANKTEFRPNTETGISVSKQTEKCHEKIPEFAKPEESQAVSETEAVQSGDTEKRPKSTPESSVLSLPSSLEGSNPFIREKVMEDGYNWRKYGQKFVKGNEFIRSYYRCTHPNCTSKKQLERSQGGNIVDTVYFGQHDHPKPLGNHSPAAAIVPINVKKHDLSPVVIKEKSCGSRVQTPRQTEPTSNHKGLQVSVVSSADDVKAALLQSCRTKGEPLKEDSPSSKRRKKDGGNNEQSPAERSSNEQRIVIPTQTLFDIVNDGYRWRKYGQKSVKGSPYPRSYYRCSNSGCPAKKHVERSCNDAKLLITTYEGKHDHEMPPGRVTTPKPLYLEVEKVCNKEPSSKGDDFAMKSKQSSTNGGNHELIEDQTKEGSDQSIERSGTKSEEKPDDCHGKMETERAQS